MNISDYSPDIHKHILACWGAASAASQARHFKFSVEQGKQLLLMAENGKYSSRNSFILFIKEVENCTSQREFDQWHRRAIENMRTGGDLDNVFEKINAEKCKNQRKQLEKKHYSYGIASKLLNCYLKIFHLSSFGRCQYGQYIHPPIDAILLRTLYKKEPDSFTFRFKATSMYHDGSIPKWTALDEQDYSVVIDKIQKFIKEKDIDGLWKIEFAWTGHQ